MTQTDCKTWLEISRGNISHNLKQFRKLIGSEVKLLVAVKSNAYGHGLVEVGKIATESEADWLGVDSLDEALTLKKAGIGSPILVLGYILLSRLEEAVTNGIRLTVYNQETIKELGKIINSKKQGVNVHIKVETGTSRQGVLEKDILDFVGLIKKYPQIKIEGLSTHYANIEDTTDHSFAEKQLKTFKKVAAWLTKEGVDVAIKHTSNSAATILFPETYFNMVRVGVSLYGLWPSPETLELAKKKQANFTLQPALTWKTTIAQIKRVKKGASISYGCTEQVKRDSQIAVLPIGYWDGYVRKMSSVGEVLVAGQRCKVLGRVCMNMIIIDVTAIDQVKIEDEVVLLGKQGNEEITADEIAQKTDTINYEVVTRINPLIKRVVVN